jgi:hypothetical protein
LPDHCEKKRNRFSGLVQIRVTLAAIGWFAPTPPPPAPLLQKKVAQGSITLTHDPAIPCGARATAAPAWLKPG